MSSFIKFKTSLSIVTCTASLLAAPAFLSAINPYQQQNENLGEETIDKSIEDRRLQDQRLENTRLQQNRVDQQLLDRQLEEKRLEREREDQESINRTLDDIK